MRKTKIEKKLKRKTNEELVRTIIKAKKNEKWLEVSSALSIPKRKAISANLNEIENEAVHGETIVVPGKVLGKGDLSKKIKISAFSFSKGAVEKIKKAGGEIISISEEIEKNPRAEKIKIIYGKRK